MKGNFTQYTGSTFNTSAGIDFSMQMGNGTDATTAYDANGNILGMSQKGLKGMTKRLDRPVELYLLYGHQQTQKCGGRVQ